MNKVTEKTLVPISLVTTIVGGVVWLTTLWYKTEANAAEIAQIKQTSTEIVKTLNENHLVIVDRLGRIETELKNLKQKGR